MHKLYAMLLATLLLGACAREPGRETGTTPGAPGDSGSRVLLRGNGPEPDSLDPQRARTNEAHNILRDLCETLTVLGRDASPEPGAAGAWHIGEAGRLYVFELRPEARWSNGEPVVAEDFVAGLTRLVDPATASQYAQIVDVIEGATEIVAGRRPPQSLGVRAPDAHTLEIRLRAPAPQLPGLLSHPSTCPVHRPSLERAPGELAKPGKMISNGAFTLQEWVPGSHVLVVRNRRYWDDAATQLEAVKYLQIADENAELLRYRAGELHVSYVVPRGQFDWIRANLAGELHVSPQLSTYYYGFNLRRSPWRDHAGLRRALSLVVDRERLARSVLRVGELPAYGWVPPGVHDYTGQSFDYRGRPAAERLAEARRLYAQAGYSPARPLHLELRYNAGEVHGRLAVAVASMWKEALGIEVRLVAVEFKSLLQDIDRGDVDLFRSSWVGDYNDAYTFAQYFRSDFGINLPHYRSEAYDALVARAAAESDAARRRALLEEAERTMLADHPIVPLYFYVNKHLVKPEVRGWYDNVMNVVYSRDLSLAR